MSQPTKPYERRQLPVTTTENGITRTEQVMFIEERAVGAIKEMAECLAEVILMLDDQTLQRNINKDADVKAFMKQVDRLVKWANRSHMVLADYRAQFPEVRK